MLPCFQGTIKLKAVSRLFGRTPCMQGRSARAERPVCRHISAILLTLHWWACNDWQGNWPVLSGRSTGGKLSISQGPADVMKPLLVFLCLFIFVSIPQCLILRPLHILFAFVILHFGKCAHSVYPGLDQLHPPPGSIPSFLSFQAECEFFLLDRDMEIYQSRVARELFMSSGIRQYCAGHCVKEPWFALGNLASQFRLQTFGEDKRTLTTG